jgi:5-methylcytosine-specific restriction endonuclease McrA
MSPANRRSVPIAIGRRVRQRARHRCGYCLCSETLLGMPMEFDHLIPQAAGGTNREENLWLASRRCNAFIGTQTQARNPQSGERVALFVIQPALPRVTRNWSLDMRLILSLSAQ